MAVEFRGREGQVLCDLEVAHQLRRWCLVSADGRPSEDQEEGGEPGPEPGSQFLTIEQAESDPFWSDYAPSEVRLMVGRSVWIWRTVTKVTPTQFLLSGSPEVAHNE